MIEFEYEVTGLNYEETVEHLQSNCKPGQTIEVLHAYMDDDILDRLNSEGWRVERFDLGLRVTRSEPFDLRCYPGCSVCNAIIYDEAMKVLEE